jgi:tetratricopeptide (TPR) repeat protein
MIATDFLPPRSPIEAEIAGLWQAHRAGHHDEVEQAALAKIADLPENRDLLLLAAISQRHLGRIDAALATLDLLAEHHPRYSRLHEERGLCHVARKDAPAAIAALLQAVGINPALPMSWRMLSGLYRLTHDPDQAAMAAGHVETLAAQAPDVIAATALFADGDIDPAEQIVRDYLLRAGDEPEAMRLLARIGMARNVLDDAETLFAAVLALAPGHHAARFDHAQCLAQRQKFIAAREELERLQAAAPGQFDDRALSAQIAIGLGDQEQAIALYRAVLADHPGAPDIHLYLGHALKTVGQVPEAVASYRAAADARPDFGDAYWSLANLKRYRFDDDQITAMRGAEAAETTAGEDRIHLCFALGKALEDRREFAESWHYYAQGNALQRAESRYRPEIMETNTRQQIAVCTRDFFAERAGWGAPDRDPIFILGLPRSGSTLIEQILSSHSQVEGTQELPDIQRIVFELQGRDMDFDDPRYPAALADLSREQVAALGERYLADTRVYRATARPLFIDKMPNNFRHIGLIQLILPNATIIDARREPMACCFSNLKQLFANGQEFTYGVEDIARYYRTYLDLMAHWDAALPGRVLRVQHEDVVDDLEGSVRRILDHCGLPFEPGCIDFHKNKRSVRTPSSEQVRQPIFRDSLDQWTNYAPWLEPLKDALGDALTRYRN